VDFRTYFSHLLRRPEGEDSVLELVRNFSNWFFDLCVISCWSAV